MQTSPDLPTTVDFGNNLVNYIEVNPDDLPAAPAESAAPPPSKASQQQAYDKAQLVEDEERVMKEREVPPPDSFELRVPKYLLDLDQPEDTPLYQSAVLATEKMPNPPALPGFLGKPILNAATLIKDDNSVLNMPNHSVLNHLATSSIKNNVLAVSATTRYKSKVSVPACATVSHPSARLTGFIVCHVDHVQADHRRGHLSVRWQAGPLSMAEMMFRSTYHVCAL